MDINIRPRRFSATFYPNGTGRSVTFDVTPEILAAGGVVPVADANGTDLLKFAGSAPDHVRNFSGDFRIEVSES